MLDSNVKLKKFDLIWFDFKRCTYCPSFSVNEISRNTVGVVEAVSNLFSIYNALNLEFKEIRRLALRVL